MSTLIPPDQVKERFDRLHSQVANGSAEAAAQVAEDVLPLLRQSLARRLRIADGHVLETAVGDAVMTYLSDPSKYEPSRGHPVAWLSQIALNRYRDQARRERSRSRRQVSLDCQPAIADRPAALVQGHWVDVLDRRPSSSSLRRQLLQSAQSRTERDFLVCVLEGASFSARAQALNCHEREIGVQRLIVNRTWDRLRHRILRRWRRHCD